MTEMRGRERRRKPGLTLIECLVVIAVVGLLAALLVVAVQGSRRAAHRAQCANNLRQIGLALNAYTGAIGAFPRAINGSGYSVHAMLLPYLDLGSTYHAINFDLIGVDVVTRTHGNGTVSVARIATFTCPADPIPPVGGWTNYAGNRGTGVQVSGYDGAFGAEYERQPRGLAEFRDGQGVTVAFAEWALGRPGFDAPDPLRTVFETDRLVEPAEFDRFASMCGGLDPATAPINGALKGRPWLRGDFIYTLYNHVLTPNSFTCTNGTAVQEGAWSAGSLHPRGVNALFVDGHMTFVTESIAPATWRALGSRHGGELVPEGY